MRDVLEKLCRLCGECCAGLPVGPMCTNDDLVRVIRATNVTGTLLGCLAYARAHDRSDLMNPCPCLERNKDGFRCVVYKDRPEVCKQYKCTAIANAEQYVERGFPDYKVFELFRSRVPSAHAPSFSSQLDKEFPARIKLEGF